MYTYCNRSTDPKSPKLVATVWNGQIVKAVSCAPSQVEEEIQWQFSAARNKYGKVGWEIQMIDLLSCAS